MKFIQILVKTESKQSQAKMFRLGQRDNKNENNLGHRDTENADKMLITKPCWDTETLKMQTGWDTRT